MDIELARGGRRLSRRVSTGWCPDGRLNWYRASRGHRRALDDPPSFGFGPVATPTVLLWGRADPYALRLSVDRAADLMTSEVPLVRRARCGALVGPGMSRGRQGQISARLGGHSIAAHRLSRDRSRSGSACVRDVGGAAARSYARPGPRSLAPSASHIACHWRRERSCSATSTRRPTNRRLQPAARPRQ